MVVGNKQIPLGLRIACGLYFDDSSGSLLRRQELPPGLRHSVYEYSALRVVTEIIQSPAHIIVDHGSGRKTCKGRVSKQTRSARRMHALWKAVEVAI